MTGDHVPGRLAGSRRQLPNEDRLTSLGRAIEQRTDHAALDPRNPLNRPNAGVLGNARLTTSLAAVLFVLLALEGVTIVRIGSLLNAHVFIGMLLIPPVLAKIGATTWRFAKYYTGDPSYRRKGPPPTILRWLGPVMVVLTIVVLASGIGLVLLPTSFRQQLFFVHRASFVLWIAVTAVHVLGHLSETVKLAPRDWLTRTRRQVAGASARQWLVVWTLVLGVLVAVVVTPSAYGWFSR